MSTAAEKYFEEGERRSLNGDFWGAIQQYDLALKLSPNNADYLWRKGDCLAQLRSSEATQCWEMAARLNPYYKELLDKLRAG